jgi:hypothetical protein
MGKRRSGSSTNFIRQLCLSLCEAAFSPTSRRILDDLKTV